jgi:GxxExxY protein
MKITKSFLDDLTYEVNGAAIEVHKELGPGLLESIYHQCLQHELKLRNIPFVTEVTIPVTYKGNSIETALRCDLFIENILVVELKSVKGVLPVHKAQLLTYMKLLKAPKGILYNFNVANLHHEGQETFVNQLFGELPE